MKRKRITACLLSALTALTVCSSLGGCYHIAYREENQQYDKVAYLDDNFERISFRGKTYRNLEKLSSSYGQQFTGYYYEFLDYNEQIVGIDEKIGWLYAGCTPLWGTYEGDEEVIWLARDADLGVLSTFLREDVELPTLETCVLEKCTIANSVANEDNEAGFLLPENTCLGDIIDRDFAVDYFEMESHVGVVRFKVRDFAYLWTGSFWVYERRGEFYLSEYQNSLVDVERIVYRIQDEYQYSVKALLDKSNLRTRVQGGTQ